VGNVKQGFVKPLCNGEASSCPGGSISAGSNPAWPNACSLKIFLDYEHASVARGEQTVL